MNVLLVHLSLQGRGKYVLKDVMQYRVTRSQCSGDVVEAITCTSTTSSLL